MQIDLFDQSTYQDFKVIVKVQIHTFKTRPEMARDSLAVKKSCFVGSIEEHDDICLCSAKESVYL